MICRYIFSLKKLSYKIPSKPKTTTTMMTHLGVGCCSQSVASVVIGCCLRNASFVVVVVVVVVVVLVR
jgi:hypothetical protein